MFDYQTSLELKRDDLYLAVTQVPNLPRPIPLEVRLSCRSNDETAMIKRSSVRRTPLFRADLPLRLPCGAIIPPNQNSTINVALNETEYKREGSLKKRSEWVHRLSITHKLGLRVYGCFELLRGDAGQDVQGASARAWRRSVARSL